MSNIKHKNYLEHEIHVKFVDGILEHSQEWQWLIDYFEDNFELSDIKSFSEFQNRSNPLIRIMTYFLKILDVCNKDFHFDILLLREIYLISKYYVGAVERESGSLKIKTDFCKILFLIVWLTKLENSGNNSNYTVDNRFINQRNFHQAINMEAFDYEKEDILLYLNQISILGFEQAKQNIEDNLNKVVYDVSDDFFEKYGENLLSANCFGFQSLDRDINLTWQENTLLDTLQISIRDGEILPMFSGGGSAIPDYSLWTHPLLKQIKSYFNHWISDFVIESIDFLLNKETPSLETIEKHCNLLTELIKNGDDYEIYSSSTYEILALLYKERIMDKVEKTEVIRAFYKTIHSITSIDLLLIFRLSFPMSKEQISSVKDYIENQYKSISSVNDINILTQYLENSDIARYISQKYYEKTKNKFFDLIKGINDISVANLFYQAMLFFLEVNQTNQKVDKRIVKQDMIYLQEYWQTGVYHEQVESLHEFTHSIEVPTEEVEKFNKSVMNNPIILANNCVISKVEDMVSVMKEVSKSALIHMVSRITISPIFPMKDTGINFDKHETDIILKTQVEKIVQKYGYKFLNTLDIEVYVSAIHKRYKDNTNLCITIFNKEKELYALLEDLLEVSLIPYEKNISLGHITQLFPLLETEIRQLGKLFGIVPFKESLNDFMKFKDPSSILRELINNLYLELDGFERIPDLLFVYHFMYNSNSLNIRNECIHGRDYIEGCSLKFGFKVTLMALYMVRYRINVILTNLSKMKDD
ncbi:hypothetical protein [Streptococcus zalophi]|uniref:DUF4209 domain-containing protein n=1 Tax=Streptococcus zalophi TaxID=640031 RepID=A0A934P9F2_9STRE|nr:hypothetical protein [Streptococcus zalophi]MBJ8349494.1 hypothetical protein [Streptococcus zalophi]